MRAFRAPILTRQSCIPTSDLQPLPCLPLMTAIDPWLTLGDGQSGVPETADLDQTVVPPRGTKMASASPATDEVRWPAEPPPGY